MLKKLYISSLVLLITILSMTVSVFAWFTGIGQFASGEGLQGSTIDITETEFADIQALEVFVGYSAYNLIYLSEDEFDDPSVDLFGLSSIIHLQIDNDSEEDMNVILSLGSFFLPEYGPLSGDASNLAYVVLTSNTKANFNQVKYQFIDTQPGSNFIQKVKAYNQSNTIFIPEGDSVDVYMLVWGNFDSLTAEQKPLYHTISYRLKLRIMGV